MFDISYTVVVVNPIISYVKESVVHRDLVWAYGTHWLLLHFHLLRIFWIRGGKSSSFECRAQTSQSLSKYPLSLFKSKLITNKTAKIEAYFEPFGKLGSSSLEPGAYLLRAKFSARASKPEPRLVPPLIWISLLNISCDLSLERIFHQVGSLFFNACLGSFLSVFFSLVFYIKMVDEIWFQAKEQKWAFYSTTLLRVWSKTLRAPLTSRNFLLLNLLSKPFNSKVN